jgi:hypothetical protein
MSNLDWLSLTEVAQLWSDETGESADAFERDLDAWFSEFVARESSQQLESPGRDGDTTNLLMAMLGGRHLQRETLAVYCEERGRAKPRFWFAGNAEDREPHPPLPSDSCTSAASQALTGDTRDAGPAQRQYEEAWAEQAGFYFEPAQPAPETANEAPYPAANRPEPSEPAAKSEPAGLTEAPSDPNPIWQAAGATQTSATARLVLWVRVWVRLWVRALPLSVRGLLGPKATRIVGGLTLGLSLLAAGFALGQGQVEHPDTGPEVARLDETQRALVSSLRSELAGARRQIADLDAALDRLARFESEAQVAKADATSLAAELTETRRLQSTALETAAAAAETSRHELILAAQAASAHAALLDQDLSAAQQRIADLETALQTLEVKADRPEIEAKQTRQTGQTGQAQEVRDRNTIAPTQASPEHAASTAGNASIQTLGATNVGIGSMPPPMPPAPKPASPMNPAEVEVEVEGAGAGASEGETEQQAAAQEAPVPSSTNDVAIAPITSRDAEDVAAAVRPQQTAAAEFIDVDSLIANPNRYDTHRVVVTGSLLRLLQHYRLQSDSGARTLIVDVAGIHRTQYEVLRDAIAGAGLMGSVRAQISGEVVRGTAKKFHLVASDLVLVE